MRYNRNGFSNLFLVANIKGFTCQFSTKIPDTVHTFAACVQVGLDKHLTGIPRRPKVCSQNEIGVPKGVRGGGGTKLEAHHYDTNFSSRCL